MFVSARNWSRAKASSCRFKQNVHAFAVAVGQSIRLSQICGSLSQGVLAVFFLNSNFALQRAEKRARRARAAPARGSRQPGLSVCKASAGFFNRQR